MLRSTVKPRSKGGVGASPTRLMTRSLIGLGRDGSVEVLPGAAVDGPVVLDDQWYFGGAF